MALNAGVYCSCWECWCILGNVHRNSLKETFCFNGAKDQRLSDVPDYPGGFCCTFPLEKVANIPADGIWADFPV